MGIRFRRSVKILPGVRLNFSKGGVSTSFGGRGYTINVGKRGVTRTIGIPGTGLSVSSRLSNGAASSQAGREELDEQLNLQPGRFVLPTTNRVRTIMFSLAGACVLATAVFPPTLLFAVMFLILGLTRRSPTEMVRRELTRRREEWISHLRSLPDPPSTDQVANAVSRLEALELTDEEGGPAVPLLRAGIEADQFIQAGNETLVPLRLNEAGVGDEPCYFAAEVVYDKRGPDDEVGQLALLTSRARFVAERSNVSVPWQNVLAIRREGSALFLQRSDRTSPTLFLFTRLADSMKAEWVAKRLWDQSGGRG